jgi:hypothetical protein
MYHYESNGIIATPIDGMDDRTILEAYKKNLLATASFTRLDPLLAGNGICV